MAYLIMNRMAVLHSNGIRALHKVEIYKSNNLKGPDTEVVIRRLQRLIKKNKK